MQSLARYVREKVDPKVYYPTIFPDMSWPPGGSEARVKSPWTPEKTPSLSLNPETGAWFSHSSSDDFGGKSIISFHSRYKDISTNEAAIELFEQFIHPVIDDKTIRRWKRTLADSPQALKYLVKERLLKAEVIERYNLGFNGTRFTIPIYNEFGLCINAKLYDPLAKSQGMPKMVNYKRDNEDRPYGRPPMLYPLSIAKELNAGDEIIICEGEWDALFLIGLGFNCVTTTAGSKSWPKQYSELFRGLEVVIAYDNDSAGSSHDRRYVVKSLNRIAKTIRRARIPRMPKVGSDGFTKDVTDCAKAKSSFQTHQRWRRVFDNARVLLENSEQVISERQCREVRLQDTSSPINSGRPVTVSAIVAGKASEPYSVPKKVRITCAQKCDGCPIAETRAGFIDRDINETDTALIGLTDLSEARLRSAILAKAGMHCTPECNAKIENLEMHSIEFLHMIPTLEESDGRYISRNGYFVGDAITTNRAYKFEGIPCPHPKDQSLTHLLYKSVAANDEVETFELDDNLRRALRIFRPRNLNVLSHLHTLADWQSRNITKIIQRPDLHIAVDLAYHSVGEFDFNGEHVHRGMLDILLFGDTRCGKGYVAEKLRAYYKLGEVASGENCSFAGLVGGAQQINNRWLITWGLIPLNHNRLVVIDEASSLSHEDISKLSRVRSEGIAEITKIAFEKTRANTRLIWMANPRDGRSIMSYNSGAQAIKEFVGANEDIARFDYAVTVATNEVDGEVINAISTGETTDADAYPADLCRSLILWAWSRKREQVVFRDSAVKLIIDRSIEFGKTYSGTIPLVQSENIRIKLAKISAAVAARVFSTDESFERLIVEDAHVECAVLFLRTAYSKLSMQYDIYSERALAHSSIKDVAKVREIFDSLGNTRDATIMGLLDLEFINPDTLGDYVGDRQSAMSLISQLIQQHCIQRSYNGKHCFKNPPFSAWLRALKEEEKNATPTVRKRR